MITDINESRTLAKYISCECKCRFDGKKRNSNQWWNNNKCQYGWKKLDVCEKDCIWNSSACNCENGKYLASVMNKIICDEIIDIKETNFNEKNITCKKVIFHKVSIFYLPFY